MKLIATDMDGTLLNESGDISPENEQAIRKALDEGIEVIVATGRSYEAAYRPLQKAGLNLPIISLNGAMTHTVDKTLLRNVPMERNITQKIQQMCQEAGLYYEVYSNEKAHTISQEDFKQVMYDIVQSANPLIPEEEIEERAEERLQEEGFSITHDFEALFADKNLDFYKVLAFSTDRNVLTKVAEAFQKESSVNVTASSDVNLEFNHIDAQKGAAVKDYAQSKGIEMKDVMTLGDHFNDETMLRMAGRGVAMGNASDAIKDMVKYTTKTNVEHGFAHAVEEMLNERKK